MSLYLRIDAVPPGEAPLWVREQWVGLTLPLAQRGRAPMHHLTSGVVSGPKDFGTFLLAMATGKLRRETGYRVVAHVAVDELAAHSPDASAWWREHASHQLRPGRFFVFHESVGEAIEVDEVRDSASSRGSNGSA